MTQGGVLFELQMPGHLMGGQEFSSLPIPTHRDYKDNQVQPAKHRPNDKDTLNRAIAFLPTPTVNDMGAGKDPQAWDEWAARQKAADGRPAPHGKSLEQEALTMLPTPVSSDCRDRQASKNWQGNDLVSRVKELGESTSAQSNDGNALLDDLHPRQQFDAMTATDSTPSLSSG
jgi:hypothetical protein